MTQEPIVTRTVDPVALASIRPGSTVYGSDGAEIGSVVAVDATSLEVKRKGLFGGRLQIPRTLIAEAEDGRVELEVPAHVATDR